MIPPPFSAKALPHPTSYCFFQLQSVCSSRSPFNKLISWSSLLPHSFEKPIDSIPIPPPYTPPFQPLTLTLFIHSPYPDSETKSPVVRLGMLRTRVRNCSFSSTHLLRPRLSTDTRCNSSQPLLITLSFVAGSAITTSPET